MKKHKTKLIVFAGFLFLFCIITVLSLTGILEPFEKGVYNSTAKLISPPMTAIIKIITYTGSFAVLCGLVILLLVIPQTRKKYGYPVALTAAISALTNLILKVIFRRERPNILMLVSESSYSFPSGHSQSSAAIYIAVALLLLVSVKNLRVLVPLFAVCIFIPLVVGFSRVYLGVHHAGDVMAGWAIGAAIAFIVNVLWLVVRKD